MTPDQEVRYYEQNLEKVRAMWPADSTDPFGNTGADYVAYAEQQLEDAKRRAWPPNDTVLTTRAEWTH